MAGWYRRRRRPALIAWSTPPLPDLTIVGAGIDAGRDMTPAARWHIQHADKVFFLVGDPVAAGSVLELNENAESLHTLYDVEKPRIDTYEAMVARIMEYVRTGAKVCVVAYGHPGVFAYPMHRAIAQARNDGRSATMLPAISSVDCLLADLDLDPAERGLQIFDASDLVLGKRTINVDTPLVVLQPAVTGDGSFKLTYGREGVAALAGYLVARYGDHHDAIVYQASHYSAFGPLIQRTTVGELADADVTTGSTVYIPPKAQPLGEELT